MLEQDPDIDTRQFGIVDMQGRTAGHSGAGNGDASLHATGRVAGAPIFYAVQGNILADNRVVYDAVHALRTTEGSLTDRVMAAMEAADALGIGGQSAGLIGAELASVVIGGLITSTLLPQGVIPVIYSYLRRKDPKPAKGAPAPQASGVQGD